MAKRAKTIQNAHVDRLSHEARGISQHEGKTVFIEGALANERVNYLHKKRRGQFDEGEVTDILLASDDRVTPPCPHYGVCGGCRLQHMAHAAQLTHKQHSLANLLAHQGNTEPQHWLPPLQSASTQGYRHKARLSVRHVPKKNKVLVGFREKNGRYVANLTQCLTLHPSIGQALPAISECLMQCQARDSIPQIEVAVDDHCTALIIRHLQPLCLEDQQRLITLAQQHQFKLYLQPKGPDTVHLLWPKEASTLMTYALPAFDLELQFHPTQFIQINPSINQPMIQQAIQHLALTPSDRVLDLFCGVGNFSLPMAKTANHVTGVEADAGAIKQAQANANKNGCDNCQFIEADLFQPDTIGQIANERFDKVLLDPPRAGAKEILPLLTAWKPAIIVYISCNPATLARDSAIIIEKGYQLTHAGIMDMFPHTQHVEAMAVFIQGKRPCQTKNA